MKREDIVHLITLKLEQSREDILRQWNEPEGTKTKHFCIDNFLPHSVAQKAYDSFPKDGAGFHSRESFREKKKTSANLSDYAPILGEITYALQDRLVVDFVAELVGIKELEPDPALSRGGLSMMFQGDYLNPHIDNSHDADRNRYRRLNLLYYVSPDWTLANGGNFELWDEDRKVPKTIIAEQNKLLVMETNVTSWHSVSRVAVERPRCCVSNYYYSEESPDHSDYYHVTSFTGRPQEKFKRALGSIDNALRNTISKVLNKSRG